MLMIAFKCSFGWFKLIGSRVQHVAFAPQSDVVPPVLSLACGMACVLLCRRPGLLQGVASAG